MLKCILIFQSLLFISSSFAQFSEGFETAVPPAGWISFDNGIGTIYEWTSSAIAHSGDSAAMIRFENVGTGTCEDWLVTPLVSISPTANQLHFWQRQTFSGDFGSTYYIRVSTNTQDTPADFTTVDFQIEEDFTTSYTEHIVDLSDYIGMEVYIAFVMLNDDGDSWFIDDVSIPDSSLPPLCTQLSSPANGATNVVVNTELTWLASVGATEGYLLVMGTTPGGIDVLDSVDVGVVTSYDPGPLEENTTYYLTIIPSNVNGTAEGCPEESFTTATANDICSRATVLTCGVGLTGEDNTNATGGSATSCLGSIGDGHWYSFTGTGQTILLTATTDGTWEGQIDVYESSDGTCDNLSCLTGEGEGENPVVVEFVAELGTVYFFHIGPWINGDPGGVFDLSLECSNCIPPGFSLELVTNACPDIGIAVNIFNTGSAVSLNITNDVNASTITGVGVGTHILPGFQLGDGTVNVTVTDDSDPACNASLAIVVPPNCPPVNDECSNAITLTVNPDMACAAFQTGTILHATGSATPESCSGTFNDDVWFSFVATESTHPIVVSNISGSTTDLVYQLLSGSCGSLTEHQCHDEPNTGFSATGLTPAETYYVRVASWDNDPEETTTFDICVGSLPPPPSNDDCAGAISLTVNPDLDCASFASGNLFSATASGIFESCVGSFDDDIWYSFVATETSHSVQVSNIEGPTNDLVYQLLSGTCGALMEEQCHDSPNSGFSATGLIPSETYYIRVATFITLAGQNTSFDICVGTLPDPPANDECAGAIALTVNSDLNCSSFTSGTLLGATGSAEAETCPGTFDDDVWYSFVAAETSHTIQVSNIAGSNTDLVFQLLSGSCGSLVQLQCHDAPNSGFTATGLTPAETYYLRIATWTSTGGQTTTFDVCIGSFPPPPGNDLCPDAEVIIANTVGLFSTDGTTAFSTSDDAPVACDASVNNTTVGGVWYLIQTNNDLDITIQVCDSDFDTELSVYSGTCGALICLDGDDDGCSTPNTLGSLISLTAGNYLQEDEEQADRSVPTNLYAYVSGHGSASGDFTIEVITSGILPLEMLTFKGYVMEDGNLLKWVTSSEVNTDRHIIERTQIEENRWEEVGMLPANANKPGKQEYEWFDSRPLEKALYRIKTVDRDGPVHFSSILNLDRKEHARFTLNTLFPQPAQSILFVQLYSPVVSELDYTILDLQGRVMDSGSRLLGGGSEEIEIDIREMPAGIFLLEMRCGQEVVTKKLVIGE